MKKYFYSLILVLICSAVRSQTAMNVLDVNDLSLHVRSNGQFAPPANGAALVLNSAIERSLMFAGGIWLGGIDPSGNLHVAVHKYGSDGHDFYPGPLTNVGDASISPETMQLYDRVWRISRDQLNEQQAYFECASDPNCDLEALFPSGYTIPNEFLTWPAIGNVDQGQELYLAPFLDSNQDGFYDPTGGDQPCIAGDVALFSIFNDKGGQHLESGGLPLGVEIHMMPFAYTSSDEDLWNTVFVHYKLINRSSATYSDLQFGSFADFDLGCGNDDIVGTDVQRNLVYAYNGDDLDEDCFGNAGFAEQPPAFGIMVLKGMTADANGIDDPVENSLPAYNGSGFGDGIPDNERHGLSRSMYFVREGAVAQTDPNSATHFKNYLRSIWKNNVPLRYGGTGYSEDPQAIGSRFAFPGDSDPFGVGTNGSPQSPWYHNSDPALPDPRIVASIGSITLDPGEIQEILIAYIYARADEGGTIASVAALQERADNIRAFAQNIPGLMATGSLCDEMPVGMNSIPDRTGPLSIYPNPASDIVTVMMPANIDRAVLEVSDLSGRFVKRIPVGGDRIAIDMSGSSAGTYQLRLSTKDAIHHGRLIKQ